MSIHSGDFDFDGDKKRTPIDLLRSGNLDTLLMEPELDFRNDGLEPETDGVEG